MVKNLPAVQTTWIWSLGWEDPLEEGTAAHSSSPAWRIPMDGGAWWATVHRFAKSWTRLNDLAPAHQHSGSGKHTDWNHPPWPGTIVTIHVNYFTTGGPNKEHGRVQPSPTQRVGEMSEGDATCPATSQNPSLWHPCWLSSAYDTRKDPESERLAKDNQETNPIPIKPETAGHTGEQFSWVPLPSCSPPRHPFPIKSCHVSTCVSSEHLYLSVRQGSTLGPWKVSPFLQHSNWAGMHSWAAGRGEPRRQQLWPSGNRSPLEQGDLSGMLSWLPHSHTAWFWLYKIKIWDTVLHIVCRYGDIQETL